MQARLFSLFRGARWMALAVVATSCADRDPVASSAHALDSSDERGPSAMVPGELIVTLAPGSAPGPTIELGGHRLERGMGLGPSTWLMRLGDELATPTSEHTDPVATTLAAIADVSDDAQVQAASPNYYLEYSTTPTDPLYPHQRWNYETAMRLPQAWDATTGVSTVRIAVLDTGSTAHPDLVWGSGFDAFSNDSNPSADGTYHHGVHVAGIVGARANNGRGGVGVCWNCSILPVKINGPDAPDENGVVGPRGPTLAAIAVGMRWAAGAVDPTSAATAYGTRRAEVVNLSANDAELYCGDTAGAVVATAIQTAIGRGVVVVVSAGNQGENAARFPADCPGVIAVAASTPSGHLAPYSNRGANIDLTAPGGDYPHFGTDVPSMACPRVPDNDPFDGVNGVVSTWSVGRTAAALTAADHCYRHVSGTSMAAPHVAGVVGLMRSRNPGLSPAQIGEYLAATARPSGVICPVAGQCGSGMVDADAAVRAAVDGLPPDIELTPTSLDFGAVIVNSTSAPRTVTIRNLGVANLTATFTSAGSFAVACGVGACTCTGTTCTVQVSGSQSATVDVRFRPVTAGSQASSLVVTSNDPDEGTLAIAAVGVGATAVAVGPTSVNLGSVAVGATSSASITVQNQTSSGSLQFAIVRPPAPFGLTCATTAACSCDLTSCGGSLNAGVSQTLSLTYAPLTPGLQTVDLAFTSTALNLPALTIAVSGIGLGATATVIDPARGVLLLSDQGVAASMNRPIVIRNDGNTPLEISGWKFEYDDGGYRDYLSATGPATTPPHVVAPGATFTLDVECQTTWRTGTAYAGFRLMSNLGAQRLVEIICARGPVL